MEISEVIQNILKEIVDSYEYKVKAISFLMNKASNLMLEQHEEQEEAVIKLRDDFAKEKSLRKRDFDAMIGSVFNQQCESINQLIMLVDNFKSESEKTVDSLREFLASFDGTDSVESFSQLKRQFLDTQKGNEQKVAEAMRRFDQHQEMLSAALNKLSQKGESATMRDLKRAVRALNFSFREEQSELGQILRDIEDVRSGVLTRWQDLMSATIGQKGG